MSLGAKINKLRIAKGESLQQLADAIEVSKAHLWELEKNRSENPSLETLKKLANHFNITVGFLLEEKEVPSLYAFGREFEGLDDESILMLKSLASRLTKKDDADEDND